MNPQNLQVHCTYMFQFLCHNNQSTVYMQHLWSHQMGNGGQISIRETLDGKSSADLSTADSAIPQFQRFIGPRRKIHICSGQRDW